MRMRPFIALAMLLMLAPCCSQIEPQQSALNIYVRIPAADGTKADAEVPPELAEEARIHNLKIWVFVSNTVGTTPGGTLIDYISPSQYAYATSGSENKFTVMLAEDLAKEDDLKVDVYVLANAASVGLAGLDRTTTRDQLDALVMSGAVFGIGDGGAPACTDASANGLPYTAVGKQLAISGSYPVFSVASVQLVRAVSKFRFVFSQLKDSDQGTAEGEKAVSFAVTDLRLYAGIAEEEYLFNATANPYSLNGYVASDIVFPSLPTSETVASCTNPAQYAYAGQTAAAYQTLILDGEVQGELTPWGRCYLRETDRKLRGRISYTLTDRAGDHPGSVEFEMDSAGDFVRNRSWIVYVYFDRDAIRLSASLAPWGDGGTTLLN